MRGCDSDGYVLASCGRAFFDLTEWKWSMAILYGTGWNFGLADIVYTYTLHIFIG